MENTGETAVFRGMTRGCTPCEETADSVDTYYANEGFIRSRGRVVDSIRRTPSRPGHVSYDVVFDIGPTAYRKRAGGPIQRIRGGRYTYRFELVQDSGWRLLDVVVVVR